MTDAPIPALDPSPEIELLLRCARTVVDSEGEERIQTLVRGGIDWSYVLHLAREHAVSALLFWNLRATRPEGVPESVMRSLGEQFHDNNVRNVVLTGELLRILDTLKVRGIEAIPYKGPTLAADAYGNLALRQFGDLDVVVRREDVTGTREALLSCGYRAQYHLTEAQESGFLRYEREYTFEHDSGSVVEVHWKVTPRPFPSALDTQRLREHLEPVELGGKTVMTFSPEDTLSILCVHGAAHLWGRLAWVCDVAALVQTHKNMGWQSVFAGAAERNSSRMILVGLWLAQRLLGAELPAEVSRRLKGDRRVAEVGARVSRQLFWESDDPRRTFDEEAHFQPLHLKMIEGWREKVRYCVRQATTPILKDSALRPLPALLFPAYRVLRPVRLAGRYGSKLARRLLR